VVGEHAMEMLEILMLKEKLKMHNVQLHQFMTEQSAQYDDQSQI
jgi:hypothetical protein